MTKTKPRTTTPKTSMRAKLDDAEKRLDAARASVIRALSRLFLAEQLHENALFANLMARSK
jgi:hypothetical protein